MRCTVSPPDDFAVVIQPLVGESRLGALFWG